MNGKLNFEGEYINEIKWNGKGIKYLHKNMVYEGNILNGKANGEGKEYVYDTTLIFEGEFLNNQRNGKGKEYYSDGKLLFEGEYLKDKKWNGKGYNKKGYIIYEIKNGKGNIKDYKYDGQLLYEGEYLNGKRNGKGKEYYDKENNLDNLRRRVIIKRNVIKLLYEGEFLNGKRNGKGKEFYSNKKIKFEGEYLNGNRWNGKGYDKKGNIDYEIKNGNGNIKIYDCCDKLIYNGEYINGQINKEKEKKINKDNDEFDVLNYFKFKDEIDFDEGCEFEDEIDLDEDFEL